MCFTSDLKSCRFFLTDTNPWFGRKLWLEIVSTAPISCQRRKPIKMKNTALHKCDCTKPPHPIPPSSINLLLILCINDSDVGNTRLIDQMHICPCIMMHIIWCKDFAYACVLQNIPIHGRRFHTFLFLFLFHFVCVQPRRRTDLHH